MDKNIVSPFFDSRCSRPTLMHTGQFL